MVIQRIRAWWGCSTCAGNRLGHYYPCPSSINWTEADVGPGPSIRRDEPSAEVIDVRLPAIEQDEPVPAASRLTG